VGLVDRVRVLMMQTLYAQRVKKETTRLRVRCKESNNSEVLKNCEGIGVYSANSVCAFCWKPLKKGIVQ